MGTRAAPSVKRLMKEAKELSKQYDPNGDIHAAPIGDGDNLFDWHFTIRGPSDSPFEQGIYHGRLIFPPTYPMKPPDIFLLSPNGRFELRKKVCLSISGYHPETWLPSWSVATALRALQAFFTTHAKGAIGALEWPDEERRRVAEKSGGWSCEQCGCVKDILHLKDDKNENTSTASPEKKQTDNEKVEEKPAETETKTEKESETPPQKKNESIEQRRKELEQMMLRNQKEFAKSDITSVIFLMLLCICICWLSYRRMYGSQSSNEV